MMYHSTVLLLQNLGILGVVVAGGWGIIRFLDWRLGFVICDVLEFKERIDNADSMKEKVMLLSEFGDCFVEKFFGLKKKEK